MPGDDDPSASAAPAGGEQRESRQEEATPWEPTPEQQQLIEAAEALKAEGNALYARGEHERAIEQYAAAIEQAPERAPQRAVYHANIAACHVRLERHKEAIRACGEALQIDPAYVKALARRSASYEASGELERALSDAKRVRGGPLAARVGGGAARAPPRHSAAQRSRPPSPRRPSARALAPCCSGAGAAARQPMGGAGGGAAGAAGGGAARANEGARAQRVARCPAGRRAGQLAAGRPPGAPAAAAGRLLPAAPPPVSPAIRASGHHQRRPPARPQAEMLGKLKELGNGLLGKFGLSLDNFSAEKDPATGAYSIKFGQ
jgi:hypothetical protein